MLREMALRPFLQNRHARVRSIFVLTREAQLETMERAPLAPLSHDELTPEQQRLVAELKREVAPILENNAALRLFCNEHTYVRYLRARCVGLFGGVLEAGQAGAGR